MMKIKIKNKKQQVKYSKMTCCKMEYQIESVYFNLLKTRT